MLSMHRRHVSLVPADAVSPAAGPPRGRWWCRSTGPVCRTARGHLRRERRAPSRRNDLPPRHLPFAGRAQAERSEPTTRSTGQPRSCIGEGWCVPWPRALVATRSATGHTDAIAAGRAEAGRLIVRSAAPGSLGAGVRAAGRFGGRRRRNPERRARRAARPIEAPRLSGLPQVGEVTASRGRYAQNVAQDDLWDDGVVRRPPARRAPGRHGASSRPATSWWLQTCRRAPFLR
jgi:hypothetical protein